MASREELRIIRAARGGQATAQLALGKRYLFGGSGLPRSPATALYWLDRAAAQQEQDAWLLIGGHIPFEVAQHASQPSKLSIWYERAFDAGLVRAGLVFAKLVLQQDPATVDAASGRKAFAALKAAANAGIADAQWLLAQQLGQPDAPQPATVAASGESVREWASRAAEGGVAQARRALADHAWARADDVEFLHWSLPLARELTDKRGDKLALRDTVDHPLSDSDALLLSRCAQALTRSPEAAAQDIERFSELAAQANERDAQFQLGLWLAKIDANGCRAAAIPGMANYKKAIRWLTRAGEQGMAEAWYALSKIYLKPECSQRSLQEAQRYLEMAAQAGHCAAQLELGMNAWRIRRHEPCADVRAAYWLLKAAAQGNADAQARLQKIAARAQTAPWAQRAQGRLTRDVVNSHPFLAARIELAALFGLSRCEALLVDVNAADRGHCLLVDIRAQRPRSKRRLVLVQTGDERQSLDRIARLFENVDCGSDGPEGNYRQRLYRLNALMA